MNCLQDWTLHRTEICGEMAWRIRAAGYLGNSEAEPETAIKKYLKWVQDAMVMYNNGVELKHEGATIKIKGSINAVSISALGEVYESMTVKFVKDAPSEWFEGEDDVMCNMSDADDTQLDDYRYRGASRSRYY